MNQQDALFPVNVFQFQQSVNITHDYTSCSLYTFGPPDDEQQVCSKHVEAYYWNKLMENSLSCYLVLYGYITVRRQQNVKFVLSRIIIIIVIIIIIPYGCLLSQAFSSWYFSWTSGDPHHSGFKLHTAVLSVLCVMFQV